MSRQKRSSTAARLFELRERGLAAAAASEARRPVPTPTPAPSAPAPAVGYRPPPCPGCSNAAVEPAGYGGELWCTQCEQRFRRYRDGWLIVGTFAAPTAEQQEESEHAD